MITEDEITEDLNKESTNVDDYTDYYANDYDDIDYENLSEDERLLFEGYMNIIKDNKKGTLTDAHTHLSEGVFDILEENNLYILVNGSTPEECEKINKMYKKQSKIKSSFGIHPWTCDKYDIKHMEQYLNDCDVIGEIGMDNVWCSTDYDMQRDIFIKQLDIAKKRGVPVILHTKGREKEIFEIIKDYDLKFLVHWYSCSEYLDEYIDKDCYFSIGPDFKNNKAVQQVVHKAANDRLLVETDGIEAVKWALNNDNICVEDIPHILKSAVEYIAAEKHVPVDSMMKNINRNFREFCRGNDIRRNY